MTITAMSRALLADDSVTIQRVIELTFADEDVTVVAVSDGDQAIERLEASPPDIVLADRMQREYPRLACDFVEQVFTVTNPLPKPGMAREFLRAVRVNKVRMRSLARGAGSMSDRSTGTPSTSA